MTTDSTKSPRGFAAMSPEQHREICRKGGAAAHAKGTAHRFSGAEAQEAGRKGGRKIASDRAHMSEIGRKGGKSKGVKSAQLKERIAAHTNVGAGGGDEPEMNRDLETKFAEENRPANPFD